MKKLLKYSIIAAVFFVLFGFFSYQKAISSPAGKEAANVKFTVLAGEGVRDIAANLLSAGLISSDFYFNLYTRRENLQSRLQAGDYLLSPRLSIKEVARVLSEGQAVDAEKTIKIIEGWRTAEINKYLIDNNILPNNEFLVLAGKNAGNWDYDFLQDVPAGAGLEGFLFPDTYRIFNDAAAEDIIVKMLDNLDTKITSQMRQDIENSQRSMYEIITLASLIEKEVQSYEDMRLVAGIFLNRVKNGQALESCATLAYILGENKKQYTLEDTQVDSAYNTYKNPGLPPGPICNPGINAIKAAVYPENTEYNYFLSRFDTGETVFSRTYEEHLANKAKYLK